MKLSDYAKAIVALAKKYPDAEVIHSSDDEGNSFGPVVYAPTAGIYNDGEFLDSFDSKKNVNAVCVN